MITKVLRTGVVGLSDSETKTLFNAVKKGMGVNETFANFLKQ